MTGATFGIFRKFQEERERFCQRGFHPLPYFQTLIHIKVLHEICVIPGKLLKTRELISGESGGVDHPVLDCPQSVEEEPKVVQEVFPHVVDEGFLHSDIFPPKGTIHSNYKVDVLLLYVEV